MKKFIFSLWSVVVLLASGCSHDSHHVRLMSYNIRNGKGMDDSVSLERVARVINEEGVDAVALQEVDSLTKRYPIDVASTLASMTDMYATYGGSIEFQGGKYGIAVLTREQPMSYRRVPLPCRMEPRSLLIVELEKYYFCSTHLSLYEEDRVASIAIITEELSKLDKPVVLAGDLNAEPDEAPIQLLKQNFQVFDKFSSEGVCTWPADKPSMEIDYIALCTVSGDVAKVNSHYVVPAYVESDHRPIIADIVLLKR